MKLKFLILACLISYSAWAETNFSVSEFNVINLGDGRLFFRTQDDEKPLEGEQRIVDGYTTEYILAQFSEGLYDGKYEHYRHNKLIEKGTYKAGNKDGVFIKYYSSGQVESETPFTGGKINGTIISYYENGKLKSKRNFKSGINDGASLKWHPETEELIEELNYIDGKFHGKQVEYALGSKTIYQTVSYYENGVRNGDFLNTRNGQVIAKGKYKNGEKEGVWNEYNDDGNNRTAPGTDER